MDLKQNFKRIVIKVGSSTITQKDGTLNLVRIKQLVRQLVNLKKQGRDVLLVSSGAIGAGIGEMQLKYKPDSLAVKQAAAAVGQGLLISVYNKFLHQYGEKGAQILLTSDDLENRSRFLNAFNTIKTLFDFGIIPIINENDSVSTQEIRFGDNDTLSAKVASLIEADILIILSDIEGLYNQNPAHGKKGLKIIRKVDKITADLEKIAGGKGSLLGTGGMSTKLEAAKIAINSGIMMAIGSGYQDNILLDMLKMLEKKQEYTLGTVFLPAKNSLSKRKQWLQFNLPVNGEIQIDCGAEKALLHEGKSLLPGGIINVSGEFKPGDPVAIINEAQQRIGKGLVNYSAAEIKKIKGHHSEEILSLLGYVNKREVIHRDNLVIKGGNENDY